MKATTQADFDTFWAAYPRKVGKLDALRHWARLQPDLTQVLATLAWQTVEWRARGEVRYIPHPATWLSQGRWMDEPTPALEEAPAERWQDECRRLHGGTCNSPDWHGVVMARAARRAVAS